MVVPSPRMRTRRAIRSFAKCWDNRRRGFADMGSEVISPTWPGINIAYEGRQ